MRHPRCKLILSIGFFLSIFLIPLRISPSDTADIDALAPVQVVARGFRDPIGIAVDQSGAVFVSDHKTGEIAKITGGSVRRLITRLQRPVGLSFDLDGRLLIVEEGTGSLLRLEQDGSLTVLAHGMKGPRWIAVAEDETVYISAKGLKSEPVESREEKNEDEEFGQVILRLAPNGKLSVLVDAFEGLQGLEIRDGALFAAAAQVKSGKEDDRDRGGVFYIPILADGSAGPVKGLTQAETEIEKPVGLAIDGLGALYVSAEEIEFQKKARNAIAKIASDSAITRFASKLKAPRGMAFDGFGNLYVADGEGGEHGRVVRLRAPPPPALIFPSFTNQNPLTIQGSTDPQSRIDVFLNNTVLPPTFTDGSLFLLSDLHPNAQNSLAVFSTAHSGQGLSSAPADAAIIHDNIPPFITNLEPLSGSHLNTNRLVIRADFSDNLSGIDVSKVQIQLDGNNVTSQAQISASGFSLDPLNPLSLRLFPLAEGSRNVSATIFDRAGNSTSATTTFTVDITPPDTQTVSGPEGTISATSVLFTVTGTDNLTPAAALQFAWRLDGAPFSAFSSQTQISFSGLTPGPHTFEVKARDPAGNEDPTPATRRFTISTLQVHITEPVNGATVSAGSLLVRGTVEAGRAEVGVSVNGIAALLNGGQWAVEIPVLPGDTIVSATATAATGAQAVSTINVTVSPQIIPTPLVLRALPASGVAPFQVRWEVINQTGHTIVQFELDESGGGVFSAPTANVSGIQTTYIVPGLLFPILRATDDQGNVYLATTAINVEGSQTVTVRFQGLWSGFKGRLQANDINSAVEQLAPNLRSRFQSIFGQLEAKLPAIAAGMGDLEVLEQIDDLAETVIAQQENGMPMLYFIYFRRDSLGRWLIEEM